MKKLSIIFITAMSFYVAKDSFAALTDILSKYCVPKNGNGCSSDVHATYNEAKNFCACSSVLKSYNSTNRICEDCITGSFASSDYRTCEPVNCPSGYYVVLISNGVCPSGYYSKQIVNNCDSGYVKQTWTYSTKTWK